MQISQSLANNLAGFIARGQDAQMRKLIYAASLLLYHQLRCGEIALNLEQIQELDFSAMPNRVEGDDLYSSDEMIHLISQKKLLLEGKNLQILKKTITTLPNFPLILCDPFLYFQNYFHIENQIVQQIRQMNDNKYLSPLKHALIDSVIFAEKVESICDFKNIEQDQAVICSLLQKMTIITGGPGTGKSMLIEKICKLAGVLDPDLEIKICASTGKAASRLGAEAQTVHRLLEFSERKQVPQRNGHHPLHLAYLIIDEASMLNASLLAKVMDAMPPASALILIGDQDQLPSVDAGTIFPALCSILATIPTQIPKVLQEKMPPQMIRKKFNHLITLQHSYRFQKSSAIGRLSEWLQKKEKLHMFPDFIDGQQIQSHWIENDRASLEVLRSVLAVEYGKHKNIKDIEQCFAITKNTIVLTPFRHHPFGSTAINQIAKEVFHRITGRITFDNQYSLLDPVVLEKNDHSLGLFNGQSGLMIEKQGQIIYRFSENENWLAKSWRLESYLALGYCLTIHKSQGSEYEHVILYIPSDFASIATFAAIYTAITRARLRITIIGSKDALMQALQNSKEHSSNSLLNLFEKI